MSVIIEPSCTTVMFKYMLPDPKTLDYNDLIEKLRPKCKPYISEDYWAYTTMDLVAILSLPTKKVRPYTSRNDVYSYYEDDGWIISKECRHLIDEIAAILKEFGFIRKY